MFVKTLNNFLRIGLESTYFNAQYSLLKLNKLKVNGGFMGIFLSHSLFNHNETRIAICQFFSGHFESFSDLTITKELEKEGKYKTSCGIESVYILKRRIYLLC